MRSSKPIALAVSFALLIAGRRPASQAGQGRHGRGRKRPTSRPPSSRSKSTANSTPRTPTIPSSTIRPRNLPSSCTRTRPTSSTSSARISTPILRLLDKNGKQLAEDDDGGGDLNARIIHSTDKNRPTMKIVATTFDGQVGKFNLKVREFMLKGEAKPREVGNGRRQHHRSNQPARLQRYRQARQSLQRPLKKGQTYTIDLASGDLDSLPLPLRQQKQTAGPGRRFRRRSQLPHRVPAEQDGVFHILATTLVGDETGEITLNVTKKGD